MNVIASAALVLVLSSVPAALLESGQVRGQPAGRRLTGADLHGAQLQLELRRVRGARADVAHRLIEQLILESGAVGSMAALEACSARKLSCVDLGAVLEQVIPRLADRTRRETSLHLDRIREQAFWEAMPLDERRREYSRLIGGRAFVKDGVVLYPSGAAIRALDEGIDDLIPEIRRHLGTELAAERELVEDALSLREAELIGSAGLLALVERGVQADLGMEVAAGAGENSRSRKRQIALSLRALDRLRRVGQSDSVEGLRDLASRAKLTAGNAFSQSSKAKSLELDLSRSVHAVRTPTASVVGGSTVWREIVALTGDLGDRDFEARELLKEAAQESLGAIVRRSEEEAVVRGELRQSDRVTE